MVYKAMLFSPATKMLISSCRSLGVRLVNIYDFSAIFIRQINRFFPGQGGGAVAGGCAKNVCGKKFIASVF